jgi:hypothetical protein
MPSNTENIKINSKPSGAESTVKKTRTSKSFGNLAIQRVDGEPRGGIITLKESGSDSLDSSQRVAQFVALLQRGIDAWIEAGKYYVEAINTDPGFGDAVRAAHPEITGEMLASMERVGRGMVLPSLLIADSRPGVRALISRPISEQRKYEHARVPVVVGEAVEQISVRELTRSQVAQVFGRDGIRTAREQRQWLYDRAHTEKRPYEIVGDKVLITGRSFFTARELKAMLDALEK